MDSRDGCQAPLLCANGCRFFGNPATGGLCSKCLRDRCREASPREKTSAADAEQTRNYLPTDDESSAALLSAGKPAAERCGRCAKKLRLCSRYECRCGATFCPAHRLPETHACTYDFKTAGRSSIAKANPVIVESKLERLRRGGN